VPNDSWLGLSIWLASSPRSGKIGSVSLTPGGAAPYVLQTEAKADRRRGSQGRRIDRHAGIGPGGQAGHHLARPLDALGRIFGSTGF